MSLLTFECVFVDASSNLLSWLTKEPDDPKTGSSSVVVAVDFITKVFHETFIGDSFEASGSVSFSETFNLGTTTAGCLAELKLEFIELNSAN